MALMETRGMTLYHSRGESNPYKTILTEQEFCGVLAEIRDSYDMREKIVPKLRICEFEDSGTGDKRDRGQVRVPQGNKLQHISGH